MVENAASAEKITPDVLVVGSGPIGSLFARDLHAKGKNVLMVDAGPQTAGRYGEHQKNSFLYQRNIDEFVNVIKGHLHPLSVSTRSDIPTTLDPSSYHYDAEEYAGFVLNNQNPHQKEEDNLGACAATYAVGGMATHWTCAMPEFNEALERTWVDANGEKAEYPLSAGELKPGYARSTEALKRTTEAYRHSARHQLVKKVLNQDAGFQVSELPLAVERRKDQNEHGHREFVTWSAADTVLGELAEPAWKKGNGEAGFTLRAEWQATRIELEGGSSTTAASVKRVHLRNLRDLGKTAVVEARAYVIACGPILTAQLLYASELDEKLNLPVGKYMTEQPMAFCQVVLRQEHLDDLEKHLDGVAGKDDKPIAEEAKKRVEAYRAAQREILRENQKNFRKDPADPIPFPKDEPEPNLYIPASTARPWHCQIHRDAFSYGAVPPNIDTRLIVDLRWFGLSRPRASNRVEFSERYRDHQGKLRFRNVDSFDMPQPTFHFQLTEEERRTAGEMMADMVKVASHLGGFMPGSEPQFLVPGLPLHVAGTTRMGNDPVNDGKAQVVEERDHVVTPKSRVCGTSNLWLGGNGLHPFGNASNPTHTSMAMAHVAVQDVLSVLNANTHH
ncbi:pyranose oxidase [Nocardiopsis terrae]|uniref:Pyranose oxidase n=1 Tax=Nocardiopsis terrae TaxID=372655 RepID=A0ABR9HCX7_9ACTN|nr:GMC oxidoreductase [Nocardiopsis terrae]MBE1456889.1 pyranose oxidase [Nocardiopsis terrae]GHC74578.1 pyranose oxidase [Nocardiopsis terrae]